jgi:hypothetical protein
MAQRHVCGPPPRYRQPALLASPLRCQPATPFPVQGISTRFANSSEASWDQCVRAHRKHKVLGIRCIMGLCPFPEACQCCHCVGIQGNVPMPGFSFAAPDV